MGLFIFRCFIMSLHPGLSGRCGIWHGWLEVLAVLLVRGLGGVAPIRSFG